LKRAVLYWIVVGVYILVPVLAWRRTRERPEATKNENRVRKCGNAFLAWGVIGMVLASLAALQLTTLHRERVWIEHFLDMWLFWAAPTALGLAIRIGQAARERKRNAESGLR
jgi:hypothetical protein